MKMEEGNDKGKEKTLAIGLHQMKKEYVHKNDKLEMLL